MVIYCLNFFVIVLGKKGGVIGVGLLRGKNNKTLVHDMKEHVLLSPSLAASFNHFKSLEFKSSLKNSKTGKYFLIFYFVFLYIL